MRDPPWPFSVHLADVYLVRRGIATRAGRTDSRVSKITRGDHISLWRFNLADDVHDTMVCRLLWRIPLEADLRQEADRIADYAQTLCIALLDFAGSYVFQYVVENAMPNS